MDEIASISLVDTSRIEAVGSVYGWEKAAQEDQRKLAKLLQISNKLPRHARGLMLNEAYVCSTSTA